MRLTRGTLLTSDVGDSLKESAARRRSILHLLPPISMYFGVEPVHVSRVLVKVCVHTLEGLQSTDPFIFKEFPLLFVRDASLQDEHLHVIVAVVLVKVLS